MKANSGNESGAIFAKANSFKADAFRKVAHFFRCATMVLVVCGVAHTAVAQQPVLLPEGQTLITLHVTQRAKVAQDLLVTSLRIEAEDRDAANVQSRINEAMANALERAESAVSVDTSTDQYRVYQSERNSPSGRTDRIWRGSQTIRLQSRDAAAVLALAGELQAMGFVTNQLAYQLSSERADEARDELMEAAIAKALEQADRAARALGKSSADISALDIDTSSQYAPPIMFRAASMAADSAEIAAPVAEAGETEVVLTVRVQAVAR